LILLFESTGSDMQVAI